jgi:hypothetical protein
MVLSSVCMMVAIISETVINPRCGTPPLAVSLDT